MEHYRASGVRHCQTISPNGAYAALPEQHEADFNPESATPQECLGLSAHFLLQCTIQGHHKIVVLQNQDGPP